MDEHFVELLTDLADLSTDEIAAEKLLEAASEITRLREALQFVENWVARPPASYSLAALDIVFKKIRERARSALSAVTPAVRETP